MRTLVLVAVLLGLLVGPHGPARAEDGVASALAALSSRHYDDIAGGVAALAVSGDKRAAAILGALQGGHLYARADHALFIRRADDTYVDAATGAPAADPGTLRQVRLNNAVRRALEAGLSALRLFAPDTSVRATAADTLFASRDMAAIPALDRALARETDPGVKTRMQQARAAAILQKPDATEADRLAAVAIVRARGGLEARSLLEGLSGQPPAVARAAAAAVSALDFDLRLWNYAQSAWYGLSLGSVLLLAATGLAITFGVMGVINMAHGEMVMLGAYATYVVQVLFRAYVPAGLYGLSIPVAIPVAFVVAGLVGIAIERLMIRFLYGRPLETLLATFGLSLILQQAVRTIFGPTNRDVDTPAWMSGATQIGGLQVTFNRLYIILFAVGVLFALMAVLRRTPLGLQMRAVTQNRRMAAAMGIRTPWVDALTFGLGSGVAGMAGVALSQIDNVSPNLGQGYIIDSFMVVVFGGVGNLWGTAVGAVVLGVINKFLEPVAGAVLGKIVVLVLLILFIQRRPRGMFPLKGRAAEA